MRSGRAMIRHRVSAWRSVVSTPKCIGLWRVATLTLGRIGSGSTPRAESLIPRFGRPRCVHVVWRVAGPYLGKEFPDAYSLSFAPGNIWPGCCRTVAGGCGAVWRRDRGAGGGSPGSLLNLSRRLTIITGYLAGVTASSANALM